MYVLLFIIYSTCNYIYSHKVTFSNYCFSLKILILNLYCYIILVGKIIPYIYNNVKFNMKSEV